MASVYPLFKLTSAPDVSGAVLFDFNNEDSPAQHINVNADGISLGTPELQGDPDSIFPQYGPRTISFTVQVEGSRTYALGKVSAAARWLLRDDCWLMFQLTASQSPVWFKLKRPQPGDLSFNDVYLNLATNMWNWQISLPAEPFAYGARQTLAAVTINNDPAAGTNPCTYTLPTIIGDAPAPLRIRVLGSLAQQDGYKWMHSLHAGSAAQAPVVWQLGVGDGFTAGTDSATTTSNAAYSGGSYRAVTFATDTSLVNRISGQTPTNLPSGRWKALVRIARSDTNSTFAFRFATRAGLSYRYGDTVTMTRAASTTAGHATWIDLGDFNYPWGNTAPAGMELFQTAPNIALQVQRLTGAGQCFLDAIMMIPIELTTTFECRTLFSEFDDWGLTASAYWDGDLKTFWSYNDVGGLYVAMPQISGGFPVVVPGASNQLTMLQQVNSAKSPWAADASDALTASATVTLSYHPRFLFIGDGT